jgi:hypothetical protein
MGLIIRVSKDRNFDMNVSRVFLVGLLFHAISGQLGAQEEPVPMSVPEPAQPEKTLPPVVVRPGDEDNFIDDYSNQVFYGNGNGSISWNAPASAFTQRVGSYNQPAWTTQRPFAGTRAYVLPQGVCEFEQWARPTWDEGEEAEWRMLEEVAIGLPHRIQLDLYERWNIEPDDLGNQQANHEGVQIEVRYALADWDVIPLNPTLYLEWIERGGPQEKPNKWEAKLLLADELTPNLFAASNVIIEQEVSGELETEIGWNNALATPIIDGFLLGGVESEFSATTVEENRSDAEVSLTVGPSFQIRPTPRTFLDIVGLFGTTDESPVARMYIVWGVQFGARPGPSNGYYGTAATRGD